jgi:hypothetical protein
MQEVKTKCSKKILTKKNFFSRYISKMAVSAVFGTEKDR